MSMRPITQSVASLSGAVLIPLDYQASAGQCTIQVVISGTGTYEVDVTLDPTNDFAADPNVAANSQGLYTGPVTATTGNWLPVTGLAVAQLTGAGVYQANLQLNCATALRLRNVTYTSGYAVIRVIQTAVAQ